MPAAKRRLMSVWRRRLPTWALLCGGLLAACGGGGSRAVPPAPAQRIDTGSPSSPIKHVVLIVQENRTFNDLFATFPNAIGTTVGKMRQGSQTVPVDLKEVHLLSKVTLAHTYAAYRAGYRDGNMDGFNLIRFKRNGAPEGTQPYQYVDPSDVVPYWNLAEQYGLADELFQTQGSGSFIAHQDLIRGGTEIDARESLIDDPTANVAWGCDSPPGTKTSLIKTTLRYERDKGPYPCSNKFPGSYETLQDLLDAKSVSWTYYTPAPRHGSVGALWNGFLVISSVYNDPKEWKAHVSSPETQILNDIAHNKLAAMSWVVPDAQNSDHPAYSDKDTGPSWVASIVNAIGASSYWNSTAIVVVWDDWGGFYDPVEPPPLDQQGGPGFRVPMIVISPYVPAGEISNTVYEFGSIVRFIEDTWNLGRLGTTDVTSTSIVNMFNFSVSPRAFKPVRAPYSRAYFLRQPPSGLPVDTE